MSRLTPQRIYATPDNETTYVDIRPGDIAATPDNDVTHARLRPADVDVTPDSGTRPFAITGGNVAITVHPYGHGEHHRQPVRINARQRSRATYCRPTLTLRRIAALPFCG